MERVPVPSEDVNPPDEHDDPIEDTPPTPSPLARRILLGDQTATPPPPKTVKDYLEEYKQSIGYTGDLRDLLGGYSTTQFFDQLADVEPGYRHHPEHSRRYWLFLALVAEEDAANRPAFLAEASRRRLFPGRSLPDYQHHLAEMLKRDVQPMHERVSDEVLTSLRSQAQSVLDADDPLVLVDRELKRLGWGGDRRPLLLLYLCATSRLIANRDGSLLCHVQVNGPPGTGKTFAVKIFLRLLPSSAFMIYVATSQKVMIHDPVSLKHKLVVYAEADSLPGVAQGEEDNPAASFLRSLLQDGNASYKIPVKDKETGAWKIQEIEKEGPAVLITTTVDRLGKRREQLDSRLFALDIPDDPEQQDLAMRAQDKIELGGVLAEPNEDLINFQAYLQALAPFEVIVPYVRALSDLLRRDRRDSRLLRDRARILSLIKGVTIIRHAKREKLNGRYVSTFEDYQTVVDLLAEVYENSASEVSDKMRELWESAPPSGSGVSVTKLAATLKVSKQSVSKRAKAAVKNGWLYNTEDREGYPLSLRRGEALPSKCGLPSVEALRTYKPKREPIV